MSTNQRDRPGRPDPGSPAGAGDVWGGDELDQLLAAPSGTRRLSQVLAAAGAPAEAETLCGEFAARSAFRIAFPAVSTRRSRILARMSGRAAVVTLAGGLVLSGGAAAAAAGALPGAAQQTANNVLAKLGVSGPEPAEHADEHAVVPPGKPGQGTQTPVSSAHQTAGPQATEWSGAPDDVSGLARSTAATGVQTGAAVSGTASDGKGQAGQNGKGGRPAASPAAGRRLEPSSDQPKAGPAKPVPSPRVTPTLPPRP